MRLGEAYMRTALMVLGFSVAISGSWDAASAARAKDAFIGPRSLDFDVWGMMAPTRSGSLDLINGAAIMVGPCGRGRKCDPSSVRNFTLAPQDLAKFRSLAMEVKATGLLDPVCIERQKKETELADQRDLEAWQRQHPEDKGPLPPRAPHDPFRSSFRVEGVGMVTASSQFGNQKSEAECVTKATDTLWRMLMGLKQE